MVAVSAQVKEGAGVEFDYDFGHDLDSAIALFGEPIVWSYALRGLTIACQGHARGMIKTGKSREEIIAAMETWKPGVPRSTRSAEDRVRELFAKMSPEDRQRLQDELSTGAVAVRKAV